VISSWAEPEPCRPKLYNWIEKFWEFECVSRTAFSADNKPVLYKAAEGQKPPVSQVSMYSWLTRYYCSSADGFDRRVISFNHYRTSDTSISSSNSFVAKPFTTAAPIAFGAGVAFTLFRKFLRR
jgi:hypothetical protein